MTITIVAIAFSSIAALLWLNLYRKERKWWWLIGSLAFMGLTFLNITILLRN